MKIEGTSKLCPDSERMMPEECCVEPLELGSWQVAQPCVPRRDRRMSLNNCSPNATFFGSNAGGGGTGVMGSSITGTGELTSCVEAHSGAR